MRKEKKRREVFQMSHLGGGIPETRCTLGLVQTPRCYSEYVDPVSHPGAPGHPSQSPSRTNKWATSRSDRHAHYKWGCTFMGGNMGNKAETPGHSSHSAHPSVSPFSLLWKAEDRGDLDRDLSSGVWRQIKARHLMRGDWGDLPSCSKSSLNASSPSSHDT